MQVKDGVQTSNCEALVYDELARFGKEQPSDREMQKARNQLAANFYSQLETISGKAGLLGRADVYFGDPKAALTTVQRYEKVTAADVQRVVNTYFTDRNRTVVTLVPEVQEKRKADAGTPVNATGTGTNGGGSR